MMLKNEYRTLASRLSAHWQATGTCALPHTAYDDHITSGVKKRPDSNSDEASSAFSSELEEPGACALDVVAKLHLAQDDSSVASLPPLRMVICVVVKQVPLVEGFALIPGRGAPQHPSHEVEDAVFVLVYIRFPHKLDRCLKSS